MFIDKLIAGIRKFDNPTVAGLDPKLEYIPASIREKAFSECGKDLPVPQKQSYGSIKD